MKLTKLTILLLGLLMIAGCSSSSKLDETISGYWTVYPSTFKVDNLQSECLTLNTIDFKEDYILKSLSIADECEPEYYRCSNKGNWKIRELEGEEVVSLYVECTLLNDDFKVEFYKSDNNYLLAKFSSDRVEFYAKKVFPTSNDKAKAWRQEYIPEPEY